jgi:hypothetical protein
MKHFTLSFENTPWDYKFWKIPHPGNRTYMNWDADVFLHNDVLNLPRKTAIPTSCYNFAEEDLRKIKHLRL